jgi:ERCC4-type nuclease
MQIILDAREHSLIEKWPSITGQLTNMTVEQLLLGDASIRRDGREILLFERKSLTDLLASIKDGRYEEQSHRLIHTSGLNPHNIIYVVEGVFSTLRNPADKKIILSAMTSLSYFKGFSVFRTSTVVETAELIAAMTSKIGKELDKGKPVPEYYKIQGFTESVVHSPTLNIRSGIAQKEEDGEAATPLVTEMIQGGNSSEAIPSYSTFVKKAKRDNITPENIGEILLCQIPGISSHIAKSILSNFDGSFLKLIEDIKTQPEKLNTIFVETSNGDGKRRKLSSAVTQSILLFLRG